MARLHTGIIIMRLTKDIRRVIREKILADLPTRIDYEAMAQAIVDEESLSQLPAPLLWAISQDKGVKNYLSRQYQHGLPFGPYAYEFYKCSADTRAKLLGLRSQNREQYEQRLGLSNTIDAMLESVTTVKKFIEAFPEFAKYAPGEVEPAKQLPANNIIKQLEALGWNPTK